MGLYEFEVVVDGDGAHGEGYVNVTVKPGNFSNDANCVLESVWSAHIKYAQVLCFCFYRATSE